MGNDCASCMQDAKEKISEMTETDSEEITACKAGAVFKRPTVGMMGISLASEQVHVQLTEDRVALLWRKDGSGGAPNIIQISAIKRVVEMPDKHGLTLYGSTDNSQPLLEMHAPSRVQYLVWSTALGELYAAAQVAAAAGGGARTTENPVSTDPKDLQTSMADKAARTARFAKRDMEITAARKQAEARKAKYMKESGGLRFTAQAMAERGAKS